MITVRRARPADAVAIGAVHVAAWRSAYPGILPDAYLAGLSVSRQASYYESAIRGGTGVYVAVASGADVPNGGAPRVIGFVTATKARGGNALAQGEVETLYVLDDWRERGLGRRLLRAAATHLAETGCRSAFVWVLSANPSLWFYERLGGRRSAETVVRVAGRKLVQTGFVWDPIERLLQASPAV